MKEFKLLMLIIPHYAVIFSKDGAKLYAFGALGKRRIAGCNQNLPGMLPGCHGAICLFLLQGLTPFYRSKCCMQMKRILLLKSTVYRNPNVVTGQNGNAVVSFDTPDNPGNFKIQVSGEPPAVSWFFRKRNLQWASNTRGGN